MTDPQQRFINLLEDIFEINKSDLDFGIYRILNFKRDEIVRFLRKQLPTLIDEELKPFASTDRETAFAQIAEIESQLGNKDFINTLPDSVPMARKYRELQAQLSRGSDMTSLETDVYSALYAFFSRYYNEGDFISKRRYKEGVYALPYEGEEVKLYWANQDQYYIKTSENFHDYSFMADDIAVHFRLIDATTEQGNNAENAEGKRTFMLANDIEGVEPCLYDREKQELIINFVYDIPSDKKRKHNEENEHKILEFIASDAGEITGKLLNSGNSKDNLPLIIKHLRTFVAKNTFDYFIHKNLKEFLTRELDFYLKNEVLRVDDLETENIQLNRAIFAKLIAIKKVGHVIIDFLAQIENYQKKLWLKKKFVVETNWCVTLDRIDPAFYPEIAANEAQIGEWIRLFGIDRIENNSTTPAFSMPLTVEFLKANSNLVLDTCYFPENFKNRLIASIEHLDQSTDGLLMHSDNFHAIRLLEDSYRQSLRTIYIDPPYNSPSSLIPYKNSYKHSSWLTLINNRVGESLRLLDDQGSLVIAIDENEHIFMTAMLKEMLANHDITTVAIEHNKKGIQGDHFSYTNEYAVFAIPPTRKTLNRKARNEADWEWSQFRNWGDESLRSDAANCFYPVYVRDREIIGYGDVCDDDFHPNVNEIVKGSVKIHDCRGKETVVNGDGKLTAVYPIDSAGVERKWRYAAANFPKVATRLKVETKGNKSIMIAKTDDQFKTLWSAPIYNAGDYGTKILSNMGFGKTDFKFPKSIHTTMDCVYAVSDNNSVILDYFAGSGTTAHAIINLNRSYPDSNRKYILTEMGEYFSTVTKPRIMKAIYADSWHKGMPENRNTGISQMFKYMRLESYEDALNNITLKKHTGNQLIFGDEYIVNYMLDNESRESMMNVDYFKNPFHCVAFITEKNECRQRKIDVVETFNYLLGVKIDSKSDIQEFNISRAANPDYEGAVEIFMAKDGLYRFQTLTGQLPDGKHVLIIWRNITDDSAASNAALDAYYHNIVSPQHDRQFDMVYVNGDNNLLNINDKLRVMLIEPTFINRMWNN